MFTDISEQLNQMKDVMHTDERAAKRFDTI